MDLDQILPEGGMRSLTVLVLQLKRVLLTGDGRNPV